MSSDVTTSDIAIRAEGLSKAYRMYRSPGERLMQFLVPRKDAPGAGEHWALRDVAFTIRRGETVGIVGRNGAGKSTLLQIISGVLTPSAGSVAVNGRVAALLELGSGFDPAFTGRENVYLNAAILGLTREEIDRRYDSIVAFAGIGDFIEQPVRTYSTGMSARLAFAVAAHVDADVLIVDEALSVGDVFFAQKCMRFLRDFQRRGTVLFVSHDTGAVLSLCDRAIWLDRGVLRQSGPAKQVCEAYLAEFAAEAAAAASDTPDPVLARHNSVRAVRSEDWRLAMLEAEKYRHTLEPMDFNPDASGFGERRGSIVDVRLSQEGGGPELVRAGGVVTLSVTVEAREEVARPVVGFYLKDRLGQYLFGDNTYLSHQHRDLRLAPGARMTASFTFQMPLLPTGDYMVCAALADGDALSNTQQHWLHDALPLKVYGSPINHGLVGIPMLDVEVERITRAVA
ncbi:MAG TPA: ABC transporter ATP-binding protein [Azospirillaceae bacterium]|nr:ABC transporter ATP-binding protein [Azospirillaceae bacterium]